MFDFQPFFNPVPEVLERLLSERNENVVLLSEQNSEILIQKDKIFKLLEDSNEMNESLKKLLFDVERGYVVTVKALSNAIEANDYYTKGHCENVTYYSLLIGNAMNLSSSDLKYLEYASLPHDIGKIGIPSEVLNKPSSLTENEYALIKNHPKIDTLSFIISVADAYDAMTSQRAYRKHPLSNFEAMRILKENSGTQFSKRIVDVFIAEMKRIS